MEVKAEAKKIGERLGESESIPLQQIDRLIDTIGLERIEALLVQAEEIHAGEGLLTADWGRPRTLGGIFFLLARMSMTGPERRKVWLVNKKRHRQKLKEKQAATISQEELVAATTEALAGEAGEMTSAKMMVIGRPKKMTKKDKVTLVVMGDEKGPGTIARGLPQPPPLQSTYIGSRQWNRVEATMRDNHDLLIIEGYPQFSPQLKVMTVYAQMCTTKNLQRAEAQAERSGPPEAKA